MSAVAPGRLRLATENGRRVGRTPKAKRLAAQPAMDVARLMRALAMIRVEAEKVAARGEAAKAVLEAAFLASGGEDRIVARALAREAAVQCSAAFGAMYVVRLCEMAEDGTLCA